MCTIRLLVVDDHTILRQGLGDLLQGYDDICVIAEAKSGEEMIDKYFSFHPDIVLSDIEMPGLNGIEAAIKIFDRDADAKVIFLTMYNSDEYIYKALQINASGIIPKEIVKIELVNIIRLVFSGKKYFMGKSEEELDRIKKKYDEFMKPPRTRSLTLTPTEKMILFYISEGKSTMEIAQETGKTKRTIDTMRSNIMGKLNIKSLPMLIKYAIQYSFFNKKKV
ncbi:MAG: response regulator transcription factor [Ignavibacteriales bacterium]|nr:response regulator transcription factor [Ignavibacteriales bacterium]